jgi:hypothetical protein
LDSPNFTKGKVEMLQYASIRIARTQPTPGNCEFRSSAFGNTE